MFLIDHIFRSRYYGCISLFVSTALVNHFIPDTACSPLRGAKVESPALLFSQVTRHLISLDARSCSVSPFSAAPAPSNDHRRRERLGRLGQISFSRPSMFSLDLRGAHLSHRSPDPYLTISPLIRSDNAGGAAPLAGHNFHTQFPCPPRPYASVPYLLRIRTWSPPAHPIHRTSSASPYPFPSLSCLLPFPLHGRSADTGPASQPRERDRGRGRSRSVAVGRSVDVGRLDLRGRMAAFPAQAQLGRGQPARCLPRYLWTLFTCTGSPQSPPRSCPVLPSLLPQFSRIDHTAGRTRTHKWSCSSSSQLPLHCTAACRAHEIELNILCV